MGKKSKLQYVSGGPLIDASMKSELAVVADEMELSMEAYEKELERIRESLEQIRQSQFALNAAIERVQSRSLRQIFFARINQISKQQLLQIQKRKL